MTDSLNVLRAKRSETAGEVESVPINGGSNQCSQCGWADAVQTVGLGRLILGSRFTKYQNHHTDLGRSRHNMSRMMFVCL
ncbi:hypothetical protein SV7mr_04040 [Stieleria bergensis]|uniref:Uncharacterized protein n=1 Tax=Stieleria bergensis TaxID=2528025 RepID=A0A517SP66_9BACT|nr:hypothetical protein SV7mr_04040 [Planctomycetes bacterium SV_7m_r]